MNSTGLSTLLRKECNRFLRVAVQTLLAPVITALLYLAVFAQVLAGRMEVYQGVSYLQFLVPGLVMMTVIQNAYANTSSSLLQSKLNGSINFLLVSPISSLEIYMALVIAAVLRAILAGLGVLLFSLLFVDVMVVDPLIVISFLLLSSALLGTLGMVAGIWAQQFEQMAAFQNFIVMPLSFLAGVFYSISSLPGIWPTVSRFNPFFYMVDGFRYGFLGVSEVSPLSSLAFIGLALIASSLFVLFLLVNGYKLRL
ncbi:MAG: ABC transporter permease [Pseudomonadales bacterium]